MRRLAIPVLCVVLVAPGCAARQDDVRTAAVYADQVATVMTQLQASAERFHTEGILPDEEYQAYLRVAETAATAGLQLSQAIQVYEQGASDDAGQQVLAALDVLDTLLPQLFEPLNTPAFRSEVVELVLELQKLLTTIRGDV